MVVLGQYQLTVGTLPGRMQAWTEDVKVAVEAFKPDVESVPNVLLP